MEGGFFPIEQEPSRPTDEDDSLLVPVEASACCIYCHGLPLVDEIKKTFNVSVCHRCKKERIRLLTKTDCKQKYLLTEEEIRQFNAISRRNPHSIAWNDMQLYLEEQIRRFALEKYGSDENIEEERERRKDSHKKKRVKRLEKSIRAAKQRVFMKPRAERHRHSFVSQGGKGVCECGMEVELEEL